MKYAIALLVAWFLAVLNVSAMPYINVLGVSPDLVLIFAVCWAVIRPEEESLVVVPMAGMMRDLLTSDPLGTSVLALAPIVILAAFIRIQAIDSDLIPALMIVAAGSVAFGIVQMTVLGVTGQNILLFHSVFQVIVPLALVNALFTPIIYLPIHWLSRRPTTGLMGSRRLTSPL